MFKHTEELLEILKSYGNDVGLPIIPYADWIKIRSTYDRQEIQAAFATYITENKIPFPFRKLDERELQDIFYKLRKYVPELYYPNKVTEKHEFVYSYEKNPLGVIKGSSHIYNHVSDQFQQKNRFNCGSVWDKSPLEMWTTWQQLFTLRWHFWNDKFLEKSGVSESEYRTAFRIASYTCSQFRPEVAKFCYIKSDAKNVLDLSSGWGDRLAGFFGTPNAEVYVGCDPNPDVYEIYKEQCLAYEKFLGHDAVLIEKENHFICKGSKKVIIYNLPAEDVDWTQYYNYFDVMMTSPPYFALEKYGDKGADSSGQSWVRYPGFEIWRDNFLYPLIDKVLPTIKPTGYFMLNIIEPKTGGRKKKHHLLCDDLVDYIKPKLPFQGKIGMEIVARPNNIVDALKSNTKVIEPIFVFSNEEFKNNTIDDFF